MFGRNRSACGDHGIMDEGVDGLPLHCDPCRAVLGSLGSAHMEMHITVTQMAEGRRRRTGKLAFYGSRSLHHEGGHMRNRNADVILQRGPLSPFRLGDGFADAP